MLLRSFFCSGEEVGPFLAKIPPSAATNSKKYLIKQKRKVLFCESNCGNSDAIPASDFKYIDEGCSTWSDSYLLKDVSFITQNFFYLVSQNCSIK